ncbi:hypothetical protein [Paracoccus aminophilus]|uniref:Uncharacterized protein n=1 Tax=Paracoccus aminophilus JCM 7686 TaxID=1367847 RepID=S5Y096_PARAH|nr:hypothetical protein [Paracoccus aminophilus]AGT09130.1 hypothetical protein JCM7686_2049 [Paracoccus aminophilus JCM 7686]
MPLPHFLLMLAAVIIAAAVTIWVALSAGLPPAVLGLIALLIAAAVHFTRRDSGEDRHHRNGH